MSPSMKTRVLLILPFAAFTYASSLHRRLSTDEPPKGTLNLDDLPRAPLFNIKHDVQPTIRRDAKRLVALYGPYTIAGTTQPRLGTSASLDRNGTAYVDVINDGFCTNCAILGGRVTPVYADGTIASPDNNIYIHHVVTRDLTKSPTLTPVYKCPPGSVRASWDKGSEFISVADDSVKKAALTYFTDKAGLSNSGYMFGNQTRMVQLIDLVNYNPDNKEIYTRWEFEYVEGRAGMRDAASSLISVAGCGNTTTVRTEPDSRGNTIQAGIVLSPDGPAITKSPVYPVTRDSHIVVAQGHMHDGGEKMTLYVNGKEVCLSSAIYEKGGANNDMTINDMTACPPEIPLKAGDNITMEAVYDIKKHPLRHGGEHNSFGMVDVMGMMYMTFAIDGSNSTTTT